MPGLLEEEPAEEPQEEQPQDEAADLAPNLGNSPYKRHIAKTALAAASPAASPRRFCGFIVLELDGYSDDGLPHTILDTNGESAPQRPRGRRANDDVWWSVRDNTAKGGYRHLIGFEGHTLEAVRKGEHALAIADPYQSYAGKRRRGIISEMRGLATAKGNCPDRFEKSLEILASGGIERAQRQYGTTTTGCDCGPTASVPAPENASTSWP